MGGDEAVGDDPAWASAAKDAARADGPPLAPVIMFAAIEAAPSPMVVSDPRQPDNPLVFVNRAFRELSGYASAEVVGRNCRFLQGPGTDPADVDAIRTALLDGAPVTRDLLNYRKDGTGFVNELHVVPLHDAAGELAFFLGTQNDLTRYRSDWGRLQESEERYRSLFEAIDVGFCVLQMIYGPDGAALDYRFVEVNPAFEAQTGLANAAGRWMRDLAPDHEQRWFDVYADVDRERRGIRFEEEAKALGRHYEVHAYPVGRPEQHRVAVLFTDVSARRLAEADLRAMNDTLERQVAERTRELVEAGEALRQSQKMEAIGQLTGGVAHDFNNLLTIIGSAAEFLGRPGVTEDRRQRYVAAIVDTTQRAAALTGQLLAFARRQPLKAEPFDVGARVEAVAGLIRPLLGQGVALRLEAGSGDPIVALADANQFDTALVNLAVNARDAMREPGALSVTVSMREGIAALRAHPARKGSFVAIEVTDTGSGIAPEDLDRVFEPFFTTKEVGKGTGLGLSQVFGFAKQSGGDVDVASSPGGTTFTLYLPAGAADALAPTDDGAGADRTIEGACILVVEDNVEVGRFCTDLLHDLGHRTEWAADAADALERLATKRSGFDLVFSDVVMPGMSGVELAREIGLRHPGLPVVLATGYSSELAEDGAHGLPLIRKPYSVATLSEAVQAALAGD